MTKKYMVGDLMTAMMLLEVGLEDAEQLYWDAANEFLNGDTGLADAIDPIRRALDHASAAHSFIQKYLYGSHSDGSAEELVATIWANDAIANASRADTDDEEFA